MGYFTTHGRFANTLPVRLLSGEFDGSGTSEAVELGDRGSCRLSLKVASPEGQVAEIQIVQIYAESGEFRLGLDGRFTTPISIDEPENILTDTQEALDVLLGPGAVVVSGEGLGEGKITLTIPVLLTPEPELFEVDTAELVGEPGRNEKQRIEINASEGTYTLTFEEKTSDPIAFDADAEAVEAALEALESIGPGNVSVIADNSDLLVEFIGALAKMPHALIAAEDSGLGGGTVSVSQLQEGREPEEAQAIVTREEPAPPEPFEGTVKVQIETSHNGDSWEAVGAEAEISGEGALRTIVTPLDRFIRATFEVTSGPAMVTLEGEAV